MIEFSKLPEGPALHIAKGELPSGAETLPILLGFDAGGTLRGFSDDPARLVLESSLFPSNGVPNRPTSVTVTDDALLAELEPFAKARGITLRKDKGPEAGPKMIEKVRSQLLHGGVRDEVGSALSQWMIEQTAAWEKSRAWDAGVLRYFKMTVDGITYDVSTYGENADSRSSLAVHLTADSMQRMNISDAAREKDPDAPRDAGDAAVLFLGTRGNLDADSRTLAERHRPAGMRRWPLYLRTRRREQQPLSPIEAQILGMALAAMVPLATKIHGKSGDETIRVATLHGPVDVRLAWSVT